MNDKLGQPIIKGSWIAYGHALGRCAGLRIGYVLSAKSLAVPDTAFNHGRVDNKIQVLGIQDDWSVGIAGATVLPRKSTLQFPDRMAVLSDSQVPARYRKIMQEYIVVNKIKVQP